MGGYITDMRATLGERQGVCPTNLTVINPKMTPIRPAMSADCPEMNSDCPEMNGDCPEMNSECSEMEAILDSGFWILDWTARPIADRTECGKWQVAGDGVTGVAILGSGLWILERTVALGLLPL